MELEVISKAQARAAGLKRYYSGKPCPHGHTVERLVSNGQCIACQNARHSVSSKKNKERVLAGNARWRAANPEKVKAQKAADYARHKERRRAANEAWSRANPEKVKEQGAAWRAANPDKVKAIQARHYEANKEKIQARLREYYVANPEKRRENQIAWRAANPERARALCRNRQARKRAAEGTYTGDDVKRIYGAQKGKCACCNKKVGDNYHVDHVMPLALGGSNWPSNLQVLCPSCNSKKNAKDPLQFSREQGLLL